MKSVPLLSLACNRFPELSRDEVYAAILCGEIFVDGERRREPAASVAARATIERRVSRFVSRGGLKLEHALDTFEIDVQGKVLLDAGASTGGFSDCLLHRGALHVHAIDVGYNQLAYRLRIDPRISVRESTNIMEVRSLVPQPHAAVADLSFRSLRGAASHILGLTTEGWAIVLVKPQFELRGQHPGFSGVVRDEALRLRVLEEIVDALWSEGAYLHAATRSPIAGRRGNHEYLFLVRTSPGVSSDEAKELLPAVI